MATQTTDQQNALKDAMARAKQIAAKLAQQANTAPTDVTGTDGDSRKRGLPDSFNVMGTEAKKPAMQMTNLAVDHTDPKVIAQQVANSLVQRAGLGSMIVEEVTIPNKLVGLVIGRGGEMINKLQTDSGAKIQVAPDPPPEMAHFVQERQITITGTTDAVNKAKNLIEEIRMDGKVPERLVMSGGGGGEFSTDMMIAAGKVGLVIGKGGETIKSLQERAGCKMVLFQDNEYANAPEKPLRISGEQSKVLYGKQLVQDLLTMKELETINPHKQHLEGGNTYEEVQVPRDAVGFVIGAKGASINMIQQQSGCRVQFKNDMEGDFKIAMLTGNPQQVAMAKAKLNEILQSHQDRRGGGNWQGVRGPRPAWGQQGGHFNGAPRPNWGGPGGNQGPRWGGPAPRGNFGGQGALPAGHKHMVIHVPANKCGLVIGKGGETLKHIHNETKVNIEINREVPEVSPFRVFHLRGTDEQIQQATEIIREKIGDPSVVAKPADESQSGNTGQGEYGGGHGSGWGGAQNQQWGGQQAGWGQQPGQNQWNQQGWNQQPGAAGWNQQQGVPQAWDQQQQWQQPQQGQWPNQQYQQWGQQPQAQPAAAQTGTPGADPAQAGQQAGGQQDYSAAWAAYYQQQSQYYQQYAMQQQPTSTSATSTTDPSTGAVVAPTSGTAATTAGQAQTMADYQAKLAEYYKSFGQQSQPQQQQPPQ